MDEQRHDIDLVPSRDCDGCVTCCKVFPIPETGKPDYGLCANAGAKGCSDYDNRPDVCREFFCMWRHDASLGDEWKPSVAGFVLHDPAPWTLLISSDVDRPDARHREPYQSQIRDWVAECQRRQMMMGARVGPRATLLLKDREIDLDG
jgi:hypothetical protein